MTLKNASNFFESLKNQTTKKSEIKIYDEFINILHSLDQRDLSDDEIDFIEKKLQDLNLESNPRFRKRYYKKRLDVFKEYLSDTFSLVTKNYYENLYLIIGMVFGLAFGIIFIEQFDKSMGVSLGLCFGMFIGVLIGRSKDAVAKREGRII